MNITEKKLVSALESTLRTVGHDVSPMSEIIGRPSRVFVLRNQLNTFSFFGIDLTFRDDGTTVLQEVNGSNAGSTGMLLDGQARRATHIAEAVIARGLPVPSVILLPHANKTSLLPEFYARHVLIGAALEQRGVHNVALRTSDQEIGDEDVAVVIGSIDALVPNITVHNHRLHYRNRPLGLATNANILAALVRAGKLPLCNERFDVDTSVFHEGAAGVRAVLNKAEQQRLAANTGLTPLRYHECDTWENSMSAIRCWNRDGMTAVAKIRNGSQGVGIGFFPPHQADRIDERISKMRTEALGAYGGDADKTALPLQLFEFAASTRYRLGTSDHLWDVRIEAHVSPGTTTLIPNSMRICPQHFDSTSFDRAGVLSNLSGRKASLQFVRTPFDAHNSGRTELHWAGLTEERFSAAMQACANWCDAALRETK